MEKLCPNCNRTNAPETAFCMYCATPLGNSGDGNPKNSVNQPPAQQQQRQQQKQQYQQQNQQQWSPPQNVGQQQPQSYNNQTTDNSPSKGMIAVGLVAVGLVCCGPFTGVPAAILGWMEMTAIKEGRASQDNMWMAQVGLWGGIAVSVIGTVLGFLFLLLSAASGPGY